MYQGDKAYCLLYTDANTYFASDLFVDAAYGKAPMRGCPYKREYKKRRTKL